MAGRGRGRGRGRGAMSFDFSQLGFGAGETLPAPVLQPPPLFPPLEYKPIPLKSGPESEYMVALRRDFVEYLRYSLSFKQTSEPASVIERFSDKYYSCSAGIRDNWDSDFYWDRLPSELRPKSKGGKRKLDKTVAEKSAKKRNLDISSKLDELAKMEEKADAESEEVKDPEEKDEDEENDDENLEEEDEDDEMDDGTDYVNSYFDNGESDDEDDNLDDGPVY